MFGPAKSPAVLNDNRVAPGLKHFRTQALLFVADDIHRRPRTKPRPYIDTKSSSLQDSTRRSFLPNTSVTTLPPLHHHYTSVTTLPPLHHHYTSVTTLSPLHQCHYAATITPVSLRCHHYTSVTTLPPLHHHYTSVTTLPPFFFIAGTHSGADHTCRCLTLYHIARKLALWQDSISSLLYCSPHYMSRKKESVHYLKYKQ
jgi:hypothetical protein